MRERWEMGDDKTNEMLRCQLGLLCCLIIVKVERTERREREEVV